MVKTKRRRDNEKKRALKYFLPLLLLFLVPTFSPLTKSQISLSFSVNISLIYTSEQALTQNGLVYLVINASGTVNYPQSGNVSYTINSISDYLEGTNLPPYYPGGIIVSKPVVIGNLVYFIYVPGISTFSPQTNITQDEVAYVSTGWENKGVIITSGFTEWVSKYNNTLLALWYPSISSQKAYLLTIVNNTVIANVSLDVINPTTLTVVNNSEIIVSNSTSKMFLTSLTSSNLYEAQLPSQNFYIINSKGKIVEEIPQYEGENPSDVLVINSTYFIITYYIDNNTYFVAYNPISKEIIYVKEFSGVSTIEYYDKLFLINSVRFSASNSEIFYENFVFTENWNTLWEESGSSTLPTIKISLAEAIYEINGEYYVFLDSETSSLSLIPPSISISSSPKSVFIGSKPQPFTISVEQLRYNGYTEILISWNENVRSYYEIFVNDTLEGTSDENLFTLNITRNTTLIITIEAVNYFGEINESIKVPVMVFYSQQNQSENTTTTTYVPTTITATATNVTSVNTTTTITTQSNRVTSTLTSGSIITNIQQPILNIDLTSILISVVIIAILGILLLRKR
jgi:hypothetical protein